MASIRRGRGWKDGMPEEADSVRSDVPQESSREDRELRKKSGWGTATKVSLGVLGGLGLLMGYVSAAGMQQSEAEAGARKAIDDFFTALNARNLEAARQSLNYPHVHMVGNELEMWNAPSDFHIDFDALAAHEGWHHSTLDLCVMKQVSEDKVHFEVQYSRYREGTVRYATCQSLWIVTRKAGHWGIQCRSILSA